MNIAKRLVCLICIYVMASFCVACGPGNTVQLPYNKADNTIMPSPNAPRITVVEFTDTRNNSSIGVRKDGTSIMGSVSTKQWISKSLAEALGKKGFQISYAQNMEEAKKAHSDYIVSGIVEKALLKELSVAESSLNFRINVTLSKDNYKLLNENFTSSATKGGLQTGGAVEELLLNTMQDLVVPVADKIEAIINKK